MKTHEFCGRFITASFIVSQTKRHDNNHQSFGEKHADGHSVMDGAGTRDTYNGAGATATNPRPLRAAADLAKALKLAL